MSQCAFLYLAVVRLKPSFDHALMASDAFAWLHLGMSDMRMDIFMAKPYVHVPSHLNMLVLDVNICFFSYCAAPGQLCSH